MAGNHKSKDAAENKFQVFAKSGVKFAKDNPLLTVASIAAMSAAIGVVASAKGKSRQKLKTMIDKRAEQWLDKIITSGSEHANSAINAFFDKVSSTKR